MREIMTKRRRIFEVKDCWRKYEMAVVFFIILFGAPMLILIDQ